MGSTNLPPIASLHSLINRRRNIDPSRRSTRFHAAGEIDGRSPDVIAEFLLSDHARDERPDMDANANFPAVIARKPLGGGEDVQGRIAGGANRLGMMLR